MKGKKKERERSAEVEGSVASDGDETREREERGRKKRRRERPDRRLLFDHYCQSNMKDSLSMENDVQEPHDLPCRYVSNELNPTQHFSLLIEKLFGSPPPS
uniref:Uncharacterized protein n=1 Tax=Nelumbo nucifera TaxID=4432 RepID=A0A822XSK4_NELNU|nr:TPA_asm: hypothetical protein HUJ06_021911 [Nelumbo nucifera]